MWPDRVLNPGPLACESDALPTALRGPAQISRSHLDFKVSIVLGVVKIAAAQISTGKDLDICTLLQQ